MGKLERFDCLSSKVRTFCVVLIRCVWLLQQSLYTVNLEPRTSSAASLKPSALKVGPIATQLQSYELLRM